MRIILHAGLNKTGSSALQQYLYDARGAMPETGYAYPDLDYRDHWKLAAVLMSPREEGRRRGYMDRRLGRLEESRKEILGRVRDVFRANEHGTVILSHENFSTPQQLLALPRFLKKAAPHAQLHVVAYVRDPVSFYPSGVQQVLKNRRPISGPSGADSKQEKRARNLRETHGDALILRAYRRDVLVDGDIVEDFRHLAQQLTGVPLPEAPRVVSTNTSLPGAACALLLRLNRDLQEGEDAPFKMLRQGLTEFSETRNDPRLRLPEGWDRVIAAKNHARWNGLVDSLDYPAEIRSTLHLDVPSDPVPEVSSEDAALWIDSYLDRDFTLAFIQYVREREDKPVSAKLMAWLEAQAG